VHPVCAVCAAPLGRMPADDAPPYLAMLVVLHLAVPFVVISAKTGYHPGVAMVAALLAVLVLACLVSLRMAKGAVIGVLLKLGGVDEGVL